MNSPINNRSIAGVAINTTDATQTVAATVTTYNDAIFQVTARVVAAVTSDRSKGAGYTLIGVFKNNGGTLTQIGSTTVVSSIESDGGLDAAFAVSSPDIQVKVTGIAATNISWLVAADVQNLSAYYANSGVIGQEA